MTMSHEIYQMLFLAKSGIPIWKYSGHMQSQLERLFGSEGVDMLRIEAAIWSDTFSYLHDHPDPLKCIAESLLDSCLPGQWRNDQIKLLSTPVCTFPAKRQLRDWLKKIGYTEG